MHKFFNPEEAKLKFLFINDDANLLGLLRDELSGYTNVAFAECHDVKTAILAIEQYQPEVIFLDHSLGKGGNEGFAILSYLTGRDTTVYSTTDNSIAAEQYKARRIEHINILDGVLSGNGIRKLEAIICGSPSPTTQPVPDRRVAPGAPAGKQFAM